MRCFVRNPMGWVRLYGSSVSRSANPSLNRAAAPVVESLEGRALLSTSGALEIRVFGPLTDGSIVSSALGEIITSGSQFGGGGFGGTGDSGDVDSSGTDSPTPTPKPTPTGS